MAFDFERALLEDSGPELGVMADYYLRLKNASATDPPDATGMLEGQFAVPVAQVLSILSELVKNEFETIYAYTAYSQTLRDLSHDSIASHFQEHADDEHDHADFLLKRMAVLGGGANLPDLGAPHPSTDPVDIVQTMIRMEQEGIAGWHKLLAVVGDNPMRIKAEEYMAAEQEHLDDLWQLLKPVANPEAMVATKVASKGSRSGDLVGRIAGAVLGRVKESAVFTEGKAWPSGDPADSMINRWVAKGNFNRGASRNAEALVAWDSQGQRTKSAMVATMRYAIKQAAGEITGGNDAAGSGGGGSGQTMSANPPSEEETMSSQAKRPQPVTQAPLTDPALTSFMQAEGAGVMAELQAQAAYYKQLADSAQQASASSGQQLQEVQQQAGDLQQQIQAAQQQVEQQMQQSQQVQQQAMATAQSASQIAAQSQQAHLQAVDESMMQKQLSEQMRANVANMKASIQSLLAQDPTQGIGMQLNGMSPAGQVNSGIPEVQQSPASQAPEPEMTTPADGGPPGTSPADGSNSQASAEGQPKTSGATADSLRAAWQNRAPVVAAMKAKAPYALGGAALGAGLTALVRGSSKNTAKHVAEEEAKGDGMALAKSKIRHAMAEYVDKHPYASGAMISAATAGTVAEAVPPIKRVIEGFLKARKAGG